MAWQLDIVEACPGTGLQYDQEMSSRWSPQARMDLVESLQACRESESETFFDAHGLGDAYRQPGRGASKRKKINSALNAAEKHGNLVVILDAAASLLSQYKNLAANNSQTLVEDHARIVSVDRGRGVVVGENNTQINIYYGHGTGTSAPKYSHGVHSAALGPQTSATQPPKTGLPVSHLLIEGASPFDSAAPERHPHASRVIAEYRELGFLLTVKGWGPEDGAPPGSIRQIAQNLHDHGALGPESMTRMEAIETVYSVALNHPEDITEERAKIFVRRVDLIRPGILSGVATAMARVNGMRRGYLDFLDQQPE